MEALNEDGDFNIDAYAQTVEDTVRPSTNSSNCEEESICDESQLYGKNLPNFTVSYIYLVCIILLNTFYFIFYDINIIFMIHLDGSYWKQHILQKKCYRQCFRCSK